MRTEHTILIYVYFFCIIVLTMILFSFVFSIITKRIFGNYPQKTKIYYLEIFGIWSIMVYLMYNFRSGLNRYSKKHLTHYLRANGEIGEYEEIYSQIDSMEKFDLLLIVGFFIIFIGSAEHTYKEKLSLLNEDIGIVGEAFE